MTPPDSVGKVVEEIVEGAARVRLESATYTLGHFERDVTRSLQALDRQRQEECEALRTACELAQGAAERRGERMRAAEAALAEARELLGEANHWLRDYSIAQAYRARIDAFLTRTTKEPNNG